MLKRLAFASLCLVSAFASADIVAFDIFRTVDYIQYDENEPTGPDGYYYATRAFSAGDNEILSASLTSPLFGQFNMYQLSSTAFGYQSTLYNSQAFVDADLPTGQYLFQFETVNGSSSQNVNLGGTLYSDTVPYFTNGTYTAAQNADPGASLNLSWNAWDQVAGSSEALTFLNIVDVTTFASVFAAWGGSQDFTSVSVPAGTLGEFGTYRAFLTYSSRLNQEVALGSFVQGSDRTVAMDFTTVPEPATMLVLAPAALLLRRRRAR